MPPPPRGLVRGKGGDRARGGDTCMQVRFNAKHTLLALTLTLTLIGVGFNAKDTLRGGIALLK